MKGSTTVKTRFSRLLIAGLTAVGILAAGFAVATPAEAATIHNRMTIKINKVKYTIDSYNTTTKTVKYNIDCRSEVLWASYHYSIYKTSSPSKKLLSMNTDPLHAYYLNDHYWDKTRSYKTTAEAKRVFNALETRKLETVKNNIGWYCLRDTRREETKASTESYVLKIQYYINRNSGSSTDLSTVNFATNEITNYHKTSLSFKVSGTPASGFTASITDKTDGYRWTYSSATGKYTESKV